MKHCGHIRIDEVGRIVIPKEMRKILRLDESRLCEMYVEKDKLVLKRYSPIFNNYDFVAKIACTLAECFDCECIVGSLDKVLVTSCDNLKPLEGKQLSGQFSKILSEKAPMLINEKEGDERVEITKNYSVEYKSLALVNIDSEECELGFLCLMNFDEDKVFKSQDLQMLKVARELILATINN